MMLKVKREELPPQVVQLSKALEVILDEHSDLPAELLIGMLVSQIAFVMGDGELERCSKVVTAMKQTLRVAMPKLDPDREDRLNAAFNAMIGALSSFEGDAEDALNAMFNLILTGLRIVDPELDEDAAAARVTAAVDAGAAAAQNAGAWLPISGEEEPDWKPQSAGVTLEAMARRASKMAEQAFSNNGGLDPLWLVESPKGLAMITTPMVFPEGVSPVEAKNALADKMREFFREHGVFRYVHACEAWAVNNIEGHRGSLANHPERKELVVIMGEDARGLVTGLREIVRPGWRPPYLGALELERSDRFGQGRLANLLPAAQKH